DRVEGFNALLSIQGQGLVKDGRNVEARAVIHPRPARHRTDGRGYVASPSRQGNAILLEIDGGQARSRRVCVGGVDGARNSGPQGAETFDIGCVTYRDIQTLDQRLAEIVAAQVIEDIGRIYARRIEGRGQIRS